MYAIIETGGKQYKVQEGDVLFIEKIEAEDGATVTFDKVLAVSSEGSVTFGRPLVENANVTAKVLGQGRAKKIIVFKYKPKKGYRRKGTQTAFHQSADRKDQCLRNDKCCNNERFDGTYQKHRDQRTFRLCRGRIGHRLLGGFSDSMYGSRGA